MTNCLNLIQQHTEKSSLSIDRDIWIDRIYIYIYIYDLVRSHDASLASTLVLESVEFCICTDVAECCVLGYPLLFYEDPHFCFFIGPYGQSPFYDGRHACRGGGRER
jgi:hypothetical protein